MRLRGMCSWPSSRSLRCAVTPCRGSYLTTKCRWNFRQICFSCLDLLSLSVQLNRFVENILQLNNSYICSTKASLYKSTRVFTFQIVQLAKSSSFDIVGSAARHYDSWQIILRENHSVHHRLCWYNFVYPFFCKLFLWFVLQSDNKKAV